MTRTRWTSLDEAASTIDDGALIAPGGFMLGRAPMALIFELIRHERQGLSVVSLPNPLPAEILVAAGAASRVDFLFAGMTLEGRVWPMFAIKQAIEAGTIDWQEHDGYRIVQRLRAAAMGLPFLPVPGYGGNDLARADPLPSVEDPFTGEQVPVERAMYPDVALIHAQAADDDGNLWIEDPTTDRVIAESARRVVATAERRVTKVPRATIPGFMVDLVVEEPHGAYPTGCTGCYDADEAHIAAYLRQAKAGEAQRYIDEVVRAAPSHAELVSVAGGGRTPRRAA